MRLGKALATGIAEETPQDRLRQEQSERHAQAEPERTAAAEEPAAERPAAGVPAVR
ncbi:hypothetical protein AB0Q95_03400 [Streptomyces sp. NPDC059900]|uniref:hypothetical protein n=1 Tax=Streptomyces sp. NPDC059900 TaxID=3155816 RepID=UPI003421B5CF